MEELGASNGNVRYRVSDIDSAVAFYSELLDFEIRMRDTHFAIVSLRGLNIWLSDARTHARRPMLDGTVPEPGGWNRIMVGVDDMESAVERFKQAGVGFRSEIIDGIGGNPIEPFEAISGPTPDWLTEI